MAPRTAQKKDPAKDLTKKSIITRVAMELFLNQGFQNTSLRQIGEACDASASLIIYHFGSKQAIAIAYLEEKMHQLKKALADYVDIRSNPELFCCSFVRLYQTVMSSPVFCKFYHDVINGDVFREYFFGEVNGINVSDLILAKRNVTLSPSMYLFYSHYVLPGIELSSWISAADEAPEDEKLDMPFRALMGLLYVPKDEVDEYCRQGKEIVTEILEKYPEFLQM